MPAPPLPLPREPTALVSDVIARFKPAKIFKPRNVETAHTSLDFDDQGEILVAACDDETLQLYNCRDGTHTKTLYSKKYGAHLARFTHQSQSIIYASTKVDDTIRYLSTHDNHYIRYFFGHSDKVTSISMCPGADRFLSCAMDDTVRLWSLNTPHATGKLSLQTPYLSAIDPSATVFAIASPGTGTVLLYDMRSYEKNPIVVFDMLKFEACFYPDLYQSRPDLVDTHPAIVNNPGRWTTLEFSNNGRSLLLGTGHGGRGHYILDAFTGALSAFCIPKTPRPPPPVTLNPAPEFPPRLAPGVRSFPSSSTSGTGGGGIQSQGAVCFTPDGKHLIGATDRHQNLYVWDLSKAPATSFPAPASSLSSDDAATSSLEIDHPTLSASAAYVLQPSAELDFPANAAVLAYNPRFNLIVSGDRELVFWTPGRAAGGGAGGGAGGAGGSAPAPASASDNHHQSNDNHHRDDRDDRTENLQRLHLQSYVDGSTSSSSASAPPPPPAENSAHVVPAPVADDEPNWGGQRDEEENSTPAAAPAAAAAADLAGGHTTHGDDAASG